MRFLRPLAQFWTVLLACIVLALTLAVAIRALSPFSPWVVAPVLVAADPPDGSVEVRPRTALTLRFATPMNRASTAAALQLDPPTPGSLAWSPDATTLTFQPAVTLTPAVTYTVRLAVTALSGWWRPLAAPVTVRFRTAPQPAVVAALPANVDAPATLPLAVVFSQPMVAPAAVGPVVALPELRFEPPVAFSARWATQDTLLLVPTNSLALATHYRATLSASLTDLRGVELGTTFSWNFATGWPAVLDRSPADDARWVSPRTALHLRFAAPLDPDLLRQSLQISPTVDGDFTTALLDATQVVTFTPRTGWAYDTTYSISLRAPPESGLGAPPPLHWQFEVAPAPRLVAFFPGQGQTLPPGEVIRLVFSTPMDEANLRAGLQFDPPVSDLSVSVNATEVRLLPTLRSATPYTITLAADTRDHGGEPLGTATTLGLVTALAEPVLHAPDAFANLITLPVSRTSTTVAFTIVGLTALEARLYPLDPLTLFRALALRPAELLNFSPERYGQQGSRGWRVDLGPPSLQPQRFALPVGLAAGVGLPAGAYYLRVNTPEGPRADLILLASTTRLVLRQGPGYALVWATGPTGAPLGGVPVTLYRGGTSVGRGLTEADGTWVQTLSRAPGDPPLLAVAEGSAPAVVRGDWPLGAAPAGAPANPSLLFADRARYEPGERVEVRGFTRRHMPDGSLALPDAATPCQLQLHGANGASESPLACHVAATTGTLTGTLTLAPQLPPGDYRLVAQVGDERLTLPLYVVPPAATSFTLDATPADQRTLLLSVKRGGLPFAGAVISWSLRLAPLVAPLPPPGFQLDTPPPTAALTLTGQATTDATGQVQLALPEQPCGLVACTFSVWAELAASPLLATAQGSFTPGPATVAVSLPTQIIASDQRSTLTLLARDGLGHPTPGANITVALLRAGTTGAPVLARHVVADAAGMATAQLVQLSPGAYDLTATAGGPPTKLRLWIYAPRFAGWPATDGQVTVVAEHDHYHPGEVARLLVVAPETTGNLLLTIEGAGLLSSEVRPVQAGQLLNLPITAAMEPGVRVGVIVRAGAQPRVGATNLTVTSAPPLAVQVEVAQPEAPPGATVPITITATNGGSALADDLLVTIAPAQTPTGSVALARFTPGQPVASTVAAMPSAGIGPPGATASAAEVVQPPGYVLPLAVLTSTAGLVTGQIRLPTTLGAWRVTVYAAHGSAGVAAGSTIVTTSLPFSYELLVPPALRFGDQATLSLQISNRSPTTREVSLTLTSDGLQLTPPTPFTQTLTLGPGERANLLWTAEPRSGATAAQVHLTLETPGRREEVVRNVPIVSPRPNDSLGETIIGTGIVTTTLNLAPTDAGGDLILAVAPSLHAALADQALALAALPDPSVEERAALALIAAGLAHTSPSGESERWQRTTLAALAALDVAQNTDGGWGWWPAQPSQPFSTAFVLEAQVAARAALGATRQPNPQALTYLSRTAPNAPATIRAYAAYVLAQAGQAPTEIARLTDSLRDVPLEADGLAYLCMALPVEQRNPCLDRLQALAVHSIAPTSTLMLVNWPVSEPAALPLGRPGVTATAMQALVSLRPTATEIPEAEASLLTAWRPNGWPNAYDAARIAAALLARTPVTSATPSTISLNGTPLRGTAVPPSTVQRTTIPAAGLPAASVLVVTANGTGPYLVSYRYPVTSSTAPARLSLVQALVDPTNGAPLDPASLRLGQLVALQLTVVVARPLLRADLELALPAGLEALGSTPQTPFAHIVSMPDQALLRISGGEFAPGVYTQRILARAVATGHFSAPPARLVVPNTPGVAAITPDALTVVISE